jgi:lipid II:glycine glycyltransferase (peptidoglycan interpeptide bridge formation enzyme)
MSGSLQLEPLDAAGWSARAPAFLDWNYRQSWAFARATAARLGAECEHLAIRRGSDLVGLASVRTKRVPLLGGIAFVSGGPLVRRGSGDDLERLGAALEALREEYVLRRGLVLRVVAALGAPDWNEAAGKALSGARFVPAPSRHTYRTLRLDLSAPPEELRKRFAQKWRNGLNRSERHGLAVELGEGAEFLEAFCALFVDFRERKGFDVDLAPEFYLAAQREHLAAERFTVMLARNDARIVAGHVASHLGDTSVYLLGAADEVGRETQAAYLLQWHAILEARKRGMRAYDLGGIDPEGNPGVFHFKRGLGGVEVQAAGPYEARPAGLAGRLPLAAERGYARWRERRSRRQTQS